MGKFQRFFHKQHHSWRLSLSFGSYGNSEWKWASRRADEESGEQKILGKEFSPFWNEKFSVKIVHKSSHFPLVEDDLFTISAAFAAESNVLSDHLAPLSGFQHYYDMIIKKVLFVNLFASRIRGQQMRKSLSERRKKCSRHDESHLNCLNVETLTCRSRASCCWEFSLFPIKKAIRGKTFTQSFCLGPRESRHSVLCLAESQNLSNFVVTQLTKIFKFCENISPVYLCQFFAQIHYSKIFPLNSAKAFNFLPNGFSPLQSLLWANYGGCYANKIIWMLLLCSPCPIIE